MKKIKIITTTLCVIFMAFGVVSSAGAITITPFNWEMINTDVDEETLGLLSNQGQNGNPDCSDIKTLVGYIGDDWGTLYKQDVPKEGEPMDPDVGLFASSYETTFFNTPTDPEDATISYIAGMPIIGGDPLYLLIKDGVAHTPIWYLFDISEWDGEEDLVMTGFWVGGGAISHVQICGPDYSVPEPMTLLLFGIGLLGLAGFGRRFRKE